MKVYDLTPAKRSLIAEHNKDIGWQRALYELIDNSFDAGATFVHISFNGGKGGILKIEDDGCGCPDPSLMLGLGQRLQHESTESGYYGIGGKSAMLYFWGVVSIETAHKGTLYALRVNWGETISEATWNVTGPDPVPTNRRGTIIRIANVARAAPKLQSLLAFLAGSFWPALQSGAKVSIAIEDDVRDIRQMGRPKLQNPTEFDGEIAGKKFFCRAGLVSGQNTEPGFTLVKAHRIVRHAFNDAVGERAIGSFHADVFLIDDKSDPLKCWQLTAYKDNLASDVDAEQLTEALAGGCAELLDRAEELDKNLFLDDIGSELSLALFGNKRTRFRDPPSSESGTVEEVGSGQRRKPKPKEDAAGDGAGSAKGDWLSLEEVHFEDGLGKVERRQSKKKKHYVVQLNVDRPDVKSAMINKNKTKLYLLATAMLANHISHESSEADMRQMLMENIENSGARDCFIQLLGKWFQRLPE